MAVDGARSWEAVAGAWREQSTWSKVASNRKRSLQSWRLLAAIFGVLGAVFETAAAALEEGGPRTALAVVGGLLLVAVAIVSGAKLSLGQVRGWAEARSASEALKTEIFRFLAGAEPYGTARDGQALTDRTQAIESKVQDLNVEAAGVEASTDGRPNRAISPDEYIQLRLADQTDYFRRRARSNSSNAMLLRNVQFGLALAAGIIGFLAGGSDKGYPGIPALGPWVAVVTTIGGAVAAYLVAERFQEQAITYFAAARRLDGIRAGWTDSEGPKTAEQYAALVNASEGAISAASEAWLADWSREESTAATP